LTQKIQHFFCFLKAKTGKIFSVWNNKAMTSPCWRILCPALSSFINVTLRLSNILWKKPVSSSWREGQNNYSFYFGERYRKPVKYMCISFSSTTLTTQSEFDECMTVLISFKPSLFMYIALKRMNDTGWR